MCSQIVVRRGGEVLGVACSPAEARELIRTEHDNSHYPRVASNKCTCGLTENNLTGLDGAGPWASGPATGPVRTNPYWTATAAHRGI